MLGISDPKPDRAIDPNLKDPKNDEIMFAFQRELANNWSLNVDWIQRWFRDMTTDQDCYGIPCNQVASKRMVGTSRGQASRSAGELRRSLGGPARTATWRR